MKKALLRPDGFAIGLFVVRLVLLVVPMMLMPGIVAMLAAIGYWLIMAIVRSVYRRRA